MSAPHIKAKLYFCFRCGFNLYVCFLTKKIHSLLLLFNDDVCMMMYVGVKLIRKGNAYTRMLGPLHYFSFGFSTLLWPLAMRDADPVCMPLSRREWRKEREKRERFPCPAGTRLAIVYQFLPTRKLSAKSRLATPPSAGLKTGGRGLHDDRCYQPFLSSVLAVYINPFIRRRSVASAAG